MIATKNGSTVDTRPTTSTGSSAERFRISSASSLRSRAMMRAGTITADGLLVRQTDRPARSRRLRAADPRCDRHDVSARLAPAPARRRACPTRCRRGRTPRDCHPRSRPSRRRRRRCRMKRLASPCSPDADPRTEDAPAQICRTRDRQESPAQDAHAIGEPFGFVQVVRRENHRVPARSQIQHEIAHQPRALRVQPGCGFVQQHDGRIVQQRAGDGHALLESLRQLGAQAVARDP